MAARKQTGDSVSKIAAKVMRSFGGVTPTATIWWNVKPNGTRTARVTVRDILTLAASCLSQDEVKGPRVRHERVRFDYPESVPTLQKVSRAELAKLYPPPQGKRTAKRRRAK